MQIQLLARILLDKLTLYSCLHIILFFINFQVGFEFKRTQTAFYVQSFIPSGLLVFASFLSLWIPCSHIPGRMTLTITTTLSLMTLMNRYYSIMIFISDGLNIKRTQISFSISNKLEHVHFLILEYIQSFTLKEHRAWLSLPKFEKNPIPKDCQSPNLKNPKIETRSNPILKYRKFYQKR